MTTNLGTTLESLPIMRFRERWQRFEGSSDAYLSVTGMLFLLILVPIAMPDGTFAARLLTALIAGGAATLAMAASNARPWAVRASWLAWVVVVASILVPGQGELEFLSSAVLGVALISAPMVILRRIASHESVTATTMWGAVSAYLSFGVAFSFIYASVHGLAPEAFENVIDGGMGEFNYFSFVTLTTLGYGDIIPVADSTRALAVLQTVLGQVFLVVVVARVVSLLGTGRRLGRRRNEPPEEAEQ